MKKITPLVKQVERDNELLLDETPNPIKNNQNSSLNVTKSLSQLYKEIAPSVFIIYTSDNENIMQGSGFLISPNVGISNYHVFKGSSKGLERIISSENIEYKIKRVIEYSPDNDYIIFEIENLNSKSYIPISEKVSAIGESVFSIGNPKGLKQTLSQGIVSSYRDNNTIFKQQLR